MRVQPFEPTCRSCWSSSTSTSTLSFPAEMLERDYTEYIPDPWVEWHRVLAVAHLLTILTK